MVHSEETLNPGAPPVGADGISFCVPFVRRLDFVAQDWVGEDIKRFLDRYQVRDSDQDKISTILRNLVENYWDYHPKDHQASIHLIVYPEYPGWINVRYEGFITPTQFEELNCKIDYIENIKAFSGYSLSRYPLNSRQWDYLGTQLPRTTSRGHGIGTVHTAMQARAVPIVTKTGESKAGEEVFPFTITVPFKAIRKLRFDEVSRGPHAATLLAKDTEQTKGLTCP